MSCALPELVLEQPLAEYSGNPQLEDGYVRIANELYDAITAFKFTYRQLKIMMVAMRKTYGWNKKSDVISLSQFSESTGLARSHVCDALNELVNMEVLLKQEHRNGQLIEINKKYMNWKVLPKREHVTESVTEVLPKREQSVTETVNTKDTTKRQLNIDQIAFDECWKEYPRKVNKGAAEKAWKKLKGDRDLYAQIFKAIKSQKNNPDCQLSSKEKTYIPHFSSWLNGKGWLDEIDIPKEQKRGLVL